MIDGAGYQLRIGRHLDDLADWPSLIEDRTAAGYAFQSREVLKVWIDTIGAARGTRPCLVSVAKGDGPPGMFLPLGIEKRGGIRILGFLDGGVADYNAPVILSGFEDLDRNSMRDLWKRIVKALPNFDVASLEKIPDMVGARANPIRMMAEEPQAQSAYVMPLAGTWGEIAASLPERRENGRRRRRLQDAGAVSFRIAQSPAEVEQFLAALIRQKRRRYLETKGVDGLARPGYLEYLHQSSIRLVPTGRVQLSALFCGDTIIAAHWGIVSADRFYYLMPSIEAGDWLKFAPGRQLIEDILEWCTGQHIGMFDFGIGDEPYKTKFATNRIPLWRGLHARTRLGAAFAAIQRARARLLASSLGPKLRELRNRSRKALATGAE
jgi:CelD/BcsL family acetyltransferase involved in cellulose biosynthesis